MILLQSRKLRFPICATGNGKEPRDEGVDVSSCWAFLGAYKMGCKVARPFLGLAFLGVG